MNDQKIYKASFTHIPPSDRNYLKSKHCELLISVGQSYHEDGKFRATVKEASKLFKKCTIIVADSLQRYTLAIKDEKQRTPQELYEISKKLGDEWIARNKPIMDEEFEIPFDIVRWDYFLENPLFEKDLVRIRELYEKNDQYKLGINKTIDKFLSRNIRGDLSDNLFFNYSLEFLLEESACVLQYKKLGYDFEVYHTLTNLYPIILKSLNLDADKIPTQLSIEFESISKNCNKKVDYNKIAFSQILKASPGHIYWKNKQGVMLGTNLAQARYFKFMSIESFLGKTEFDFLPYNLAYEIRKNDLEVINQKKTYIFEEKVSSNGLENTFLSYKSPLIDEQNSVVGILGISLDITKQKIIEQELVEKNQLLSEAINARDLFLRNVSHEIKIPLSCILKISNHLYDDWDNFADNDARKSQLKMAIDNNQRLYSVLMNLLDMSQVKSGKITYNKIPYSFSKSVYDVVNEFIDHRYRIKCTDNLREVKLIFDPFRIEQVVRNLIANAIKYGGEEDIAIQINEFNRNDHNFISFEIVDYGVGIPEDELELIFEIFIQSSRTNNMAGGSGIGLSICKKIIADHGGDIFAKNNLPRGSIFYFEIPLVENNIISDDKIIKNIIKIKPKSGEKPVLLIIDDEDNLIQITAMILTSLGFEVIKAESGKVGLSKLEKYFHRIDVVMLDIMMPDINGVEVLKKIRNDQLLRSIPVFMYSGLSNCNEVDECEKLGISGLIDKAANKEKIREYLEEFL